MTSGYFKINGIFKFKWKFPLLSCFHFWNIVSQPDDTKTMKMKRMKIENTLSHSWWNFLIFPYTTASLQFASFFALLIAKYALFIIMMTNGFLFRGKIENNEGPNYVIKQNLEIPGGPSNFESGPGVFVQWDHSFI